MTTDAAQKERQESPLRFIRLEANPQLGEPLGMDCFKIRMSISGKPAGKRGGARIITHVRITESVVFFLSIYDKSEVSTITKQEIKARLKAAGGG
jgi:hypothetical protein